MEKAERSVPESQTRGVWTSDSFAVIANALGILILGFTHPKT
jgi:hypothetical protein